MSAAPDPAVTLVIPAYNEARRLPDSLRELARFLDGQSHPMEVLVVVERSTDDTLTAARAAVADDTRFQILDNQVHRGKGYAVRSGMLRAAGDIVLFMDADLSTPLAEIPTFLRHLHDHPDTQLVIGSRALARSQVEKPQSALRRNMGRTFNRLVQRFGIADISDTQCGFKAFRRPAAQAIFQRQKLDGFAFDVEVLLLAQALGLRVDVLPVRWINSTDSKVHIVQDSLRMLRDLLRIRALVRRTLQEQPITPV